MGGIISTLRNYIHTKVENTKQCIKNGVTNTKNAITTRIENAQNAVVGRINAAADAVYQSVENTRKGFIRRVENTRNAVTTRYTNCKTAVVDRVTQVVNTVTYVKDTVVTSVTNTKNAIVTRATNAKNTVVTTYTETKENVYNRYRRIREAKLTPWQKFKYSVFGIFLLVVLATLFLLSLDVYYEEYDRAHERLVAIRSVLCYIWEITLIAVEYTVYYLFVGTREACILLASWSHTAGVYLIFGAGVLWENLKAGSCIVAEYSAFAASVSAEYLLHFCEVSGRHIWHGTQIVAGYTGQGLTIAWEYIKMGSSIGWEYTLIGSAFAWEHIKIGSQITSEYATIGAKLGLEYGSFALKEGTVRFVKGSIYLLTNFRAASYEGSVYFLQTSQWLAGALVQGAYHGSIYFMEGTKYLAEFTYLGTIALVQFLYLSVVTLSYWIYVAVTSTYNGLVYFSQNASYVTTQTAQACYEYSWWIAITTYHGFIISCVVLAEWSCKAFCLITTWTITGAITLWTWLTTFITTTAQTLHLTLNKYALQWLYISLCSAVKLVTFISHILVVFFVDLGGYMGNFIATISRHVYSVVYVVVMFIHQLVSGVVSGVRGITAVVVYCLTSIFGGIAFVLEEVVFGYMYMLQKYTMYREVLFVAFIALMSLYCTGLMRDRSRYQDDDEDEDYDDDDDDDASVSGKSQGSDEGDSELPRSKPKVKVNKFALDPMEEPPAYDTVENLPSYTEATTTPEDDFLPPSDDEDDEFDLGQDMPDFMDSGSDLSDLDPEHNDDPVSEHSEAELYPTKNGKELRSSHSDVEFPTQDIGDGYARKPIDDEPLYDKESFEVEDLRPIEVDAHVRDLDIESYENEGDLDFNFDDEHSDRDEDSAGLGLPFLDKVTGLFNRKKDN